MIRFIYALLASVIVLGACATSAQEADNDLAAQWNLTDLFPTVEAWDQERQRMLQEFDRIEAYKGTLGNSSAALYQALRFVSDTYRQALRVYVYASLNGDEDLRETAAQERNQLGEAMFARMNEATAWMDPEIIAIGEERIRQFLDDNVDLAPFRHQLDNTLRRASHTLGAEAEQALSFFSQPFDAPSGIYGIISNSDIPFPTYTLPGGEEVRIDSQGYGRLRSDGNRDVRKQVFDLFWGKWKEYSNSIGMVLNSHLQTQVALAKARKYNSVLERELFEDNLPSEVYYTLVEEVNKALPTLHRYFKLRARMLGVEQLHYYDIYPPLVALDKKFDLENSKKTTLAAMSILGNDWVELLGAASVIDLLFIPSRENAAAPTCRARPMMSTRTCFSITMTTSTRCRLLHTSGDMRCIHCMQNRHSLLKLPTTQPSLQKSRQLHWNSSCSST